MKIGEFMIQTIGIVYILSLYLSIPGFIGKAGYNWLLGFIPFVNLYYLVLTLKIEPILLILVGILLIVFPERILIGTCIVMFLPFMIADCFETDLFYSFGCLILPFIFYPFIAYFHGSYLY